MNDKLQKLKEQHDIEFHNIQFEDAKLERLKQSFKFLGEITAIGKVAQSLDANHLRGMQAIESQKIYLDMGYETFVDFLNSDHSPLSKSTYYTRIKILEAEGDNVFNLLNEIGVAHSARKLLASGNYDAIEFTENGLIINGQPTEISNFREVKSLIESFADELKKVKSDNTKKQEKLETAEKIIHEGSKQVEELRRQLDSNSEGSAFDRSQSRLLNAFIKFNGELSELPLVQRVNKDSVLDTLWQLLQKSRELFGSNTAFTVSSATDNGIDPLLAQVMADGFEDE